MIATYVADVCAGTSALSLESDVSRRNSTFLLLAQARTLDVDKDMQPVVSFLIAEGISKGDVLKVMRLYHSTSFCLQQSLYLVPSSYLTLWHLLHPATGHAESGFECVFARHVLFHVLFTCWICAHYRILQIISAHPPVLSYSIDGRLQPFWSYLASIGVKVGAHQASFSWCSCALTCQTLLACGSCYLPYTTIMP